MYEYSLVIFLERQLPKEVAGYLSAKLSNEERAHLIKLLMNMPGDPLTDEVEFVLRHFSICSENRHNLLHSRPGLTRLGDIRKDVLTLEKFARGDPQKLLAFRLNIGDLRRVADEMDAGFKFVADLWRFMFDRDHYYRVLAEAEAAGIPGPAPSVYPTLPKRPPEPRKIDPDPPT